jgi:hypothetical protein
VRETMTNIKAELYETHETRLACLKAEARRRLTAKEERETQTDRTRASSRIDQDVGIRLDESGYV